MSQVQFNLLRPLPPDHSSPSQLNSFIVPQDWNPDHLYLYLKNWDLKRLTALDVETKGNEAHNRESYVIGVGLSQSNLAVYFPISTKEQWTKFCTYLQNSQLPLIAHNLTYDAAWFIRDNFKLNWVGCTYAWLRSLANEGWAGQRWGLKDSMVDLLAWPSSNEELLDKWLIDNGHVKSIAKEKKDGYYFYPEKDRWFSPQKAEMWRAPSDILGTYCCLDAYATIQLYEHVLVEILDSEDFGDLFDQYSKWMLRLILKTIEQQLRGIQIDVPQVEKHLEFLKQEIERTEKELIGHPEVVPSISLYNKMQVEEIRKKEPKQFKKDGSRSKLHENWAAKVEEAKQVQHFNLNSSKQKQWLFYEQLKFPILRETESGEAAVDGKALLGFGEVGRLFTELTHLTKEHSYVEKCLELTRDTGILHPQLRVPGTLTGRCSGSGGLNIQQLPKSKQYLKAWVAREGYCWIDFDFTAIEPIVLTELSRDRAMLSVYGPDAGPNDIYLLTGSGLPGLKNKILEAGYNPSLPTKEGIANAKKKAKLERGVAKIVTLGSNYGMGPKKLRDDLSLHGFPVSFEEAKEIHKSYWSLYKGIKEFESYLLGQLETTGGWILNGLGRPISVASGYEKDIVNRVVQSTAHDILMLYIYLLTDNLAKEGVDYAPIIIDFHDQIILEAKVSDANAVINIVNQTVDELNAQLGGLIKMKGTPQIVTNLAQAKIEE